MRESLRSPKPPSGAAEKTALPRRVPKWGDDRLVCASVGGQGLGLGRGSTGAGGIMTRGGTPMA